MKHAAHKPSSIFWIILLAVATSVPAAPAERGVTITPDVVYGHKYGMALTMDVFQPKEGNGIGVLFMISEQIEELRNTLLPLPVAPATRR